MLWKWGLLNPYAIEFVKVSIQMCVNSILGKKKFFWIRQLKDDDGIGLVPWKKVNDE